MPERPAPAQTPEVRFSPAVQENTRTAEVELVKDAEPAGVAPVVQAGSKCYSCGQQFRIDIYEGDFCPVCGVNLNGPGAKTNTERARMDEEREKALAARAQGPGPADLAQQEMAPPPRARKPRATAVVAPAPEPVAPPAPVCLAGPGRPVTLPPSTVRVMPPGPSIVVLPHARPANPSQAVAVIPATRQAVVLHDPSTWLDENAVPISLEDVYMPRINIVQKVGDLSNVHIHGSVVLSQTLALYVPEQTCPDGKGGLQKIEATAPLQTVIVCFRPMQYVEKVPGGEHRGELFNSPDEVLAYGGTLDYNEAAADPNKPYFQKLATALVILRKPEFVADLESFPYELDGVRYAPALWSMKGTAFTHAYKAIATTKVHGPLRGRKYFERSWDLSTQLKKFQANFAYVPVIKLGNDTPAGFPQLIQEILCRPRTVSEPPAGESD